VTIINDDSSIINNLRFKLIDDARVIIYDRERFIIQARAGGKHASILVKRLIFVKISEKHSSLSHIKYLNLVPLGQYCNVFLQLQLTF
jgi:hypothetical protein